MTCYQTQTYLSAGHQLSHQLLLRAGHQLSLQLLLRPCSCSYQQVARPQTCYRLRSQTCAATSYLQRTCQVPVTCPALVLLQPVTSLHQQPRQVVVGACAPPCMPLGPAGAVAVPRVNEQRRCPPLRLYRAAGGPASRRQRSSGRRLLPPTRRTGRTTALSGSQRTRRRGTDERGCAARRRPPVPPRPHRGAVPATGNQVEGKVVLNDNSPPANARLLFVSAEKQGPQETVTADNNGRFNVTLASGDWLVYLTGTDGKPVFHSKIDISSKDTRLSSWSTR